MSGLSDRAKQLIKQARIVSFEPWGTTHPPEAISIFQTADDAGLYLSDQDLAGLTQHCPNQTQNFATMVTLRDQVADIVNEARADVLTQFPGITEPGGSLYPALRADACWRDFWHFLRCISYGIAGQHTTYTSATGLNAMQELYQELKVPLPAMIVGLAGIKSASLSRFEQRSREDLTPYFDHLLTQMNKFQ